jgi:uncharacterized membrane protein YdjX (TVP38/TMEM64 family)
LRRVTLIFLVLVVAALVGAVLLTPQGRELTREPKAFAEAARSFAQVHPLLAPLLLLGVYLVLSLALLPVWWLQVLAGCAFGLYGGTSLCCACSGVGASCVVWTSRWLGATELRRRAEARVARLAWLMEKAGNNGVLSVMAVRLTHVMPFSVSNNLIAMTPIRVREVMVGTMLGNVPSIACYVALGAEPGLLATWGFWCAVVGINVSLLVPMAARAAWVRWARAG